MGRVAMLRLVGAGLVVFGGMLAFVALISSLGALDGRSSWPVFVGLPFVLLGLLALSFWLFNPTGTDPLGSKRPEQQLRELEEGGLLASTSFRATRAFGVEEAEDEGLHYYLELDDGRVLFLSGQYLYDYEPDDDPEFARPRKFPCTEFTVRRHKDEGWVAEIVCSGAILEPEIVLHPFRTKEWHTNVVPEDGQVLSDIRYDDLKRARLSVSEA